MSSAAAEIGLTPLTVMLVESPSAAVAYTEALIDELASGWRPVSVAIANRDETYFTQMSITDNLTLGSGRSGRQAELEAIALAESLGIATNGGVPNRYDRELICLLRHIADRPDVLVTAWSFDEYDAQRHRSISDLLLGRVYSGLATVLVTTGWSAWLKHADTALVVRDDGVAYIGSPQNLTERRANLLLKSSAAAAELLRQELALVLANDDRHEPVAQDMANLFADVSGARSVGFAVGRTGFEPWWAIRNADEADSETLAICRHRVGSRPLISGVKAIRDIDGVEAIGGSTERGGWMAVLVPDAPWWAVDRGRTERLVSEAVENFLVKRDSLQASRDLSRAQMVTSLVGGLAHDFNNSLQTIYGLVGLLEDSDDTAERARLFESLRIVSGDAREFVSRLVVLSRRSDLVVVEVDMHQVIEEVGDLMLASFTNKADIEYRLDASDCRVMGDATELRNTLSNIVGNAMHVVDEGGHIEIRTTNVDEAGRPAQLRIDIADDGPGIPTDLLETLFDPFATRREGGTGLGLAVCRSIVEEHGGSIYVSATSEGGATITVELPITDIGNELTGPSAADDGDRSVDESSLQAMEIVLCDDDDMVRAVVAEMLRSAGYSVIEVSCGPEALDVIDRRCGEVGLLIVDQMMPNMRGDEVVEAVAERGPEIPVIWLSGFRDTGTDIEIKVAERLCKPVSIEELTKAVSRHVLRQPSDLAN